VYYYGHTQVTECSPLNDLNEKLRKDRESIERAQVMKELKVIAVLLLSAVVQRATCVSIYTSISDSEHVASDNRIPKKLQPVELMTDATNHLGFTILDLHSKLNKNNIALSPCGLMSVLVALYEGTGGKSGIELKEALEFPRERDVVRIGVRDIHRRLRVRHPPWRRSRLIIDYYYYDRRVTITRSLRVCVCVWVELSALQALCFNPSTPLTSEFDGQVEESSLRAANDD
jgi:hypothetical protein